MSVARDPVSSDTRSVPARLVTGRMCCRETRPETGFPGTRAKTGFLERLSSTRTLKLWSPPLIPRSNCGNPVLAHRHFRRTPLAAGGGATGDAAVDDRPVDYTLVRRPLRVATSARLLDGEQVQTLHEPGHGTEGSVWRLSVSCIVKQIGECLVGKAVEEETIVTIDDEVVRRAGCGAAVLEECDAVSAIECRQGRREDAHIGVQAGDHDVPGTAALQMPAQFGAGEAVEVPLDEDRLSLLLRRALQRPRTIAAGQTQP